MTLSLWFLYVITFGAAIALPGANAAYAIAQGITNGVRGGLMAASGFALATALNQGIVLAGLGLLLSSHMDILIYLKWAGVAYMLVLAYKAWNAKPSSEQQAESISRARIFFTAILVSLSNPKVILVNMMLLPVYISADKPLATQAVTILCTGAIISFCVYASYAFFASKFITRLKSKAANNVVASIYASAAGALAMVNR